MYRIEKKFTIATGHRLSKHTGLCKNFHGHNLTILVGVKAKELAKNDMIVDFSALKSVVNQYLSIFDHCLLLNKSDRELANLFLNQGFKVEIFDFDPTAEQLSYMFYEDLKYRLMDSLGVEIDYVTVYENENSKATYSPE